MTAVSGHLAENDDKAQPAIVTEADRALLLSMAAWAAGSIAADPTADQAEKEHDFIWKFCGRLEPRWVKRLRAAWDRAALSPDRFEMPDAIDRLRKLHVSSVSAELPRVHSTWLIRALQEESPAVQRMVAASLTGPLRHSIQAGLLLDEQDIASERPVNLFVRDWVMGLWTERLVGGEPVRSDDPPALFAVYGLSLRAGLRLCRMAGLGKMVVASEASATGLLGPLNRQRSEWLKDNLRGTEPEFEECARRDLRSIVRSSLPRRHHGGRLGLFTIARLLADSEPFRLRWALQHWPYAIVKLIRSIMANPSSRDQAILRGESRVLKIAWERLTLEGRLADRWTSSDRESES